MKRLRQHVTVKSISGIVLLLVTFSVIVSVIGYRSFTSALLDRWLALLRDYGEAIALAHIRLELRQPDY